MTVIVKDQIVFTYTDKSLEFTWILRGKVLANAGDLYIGGYPHRSSVTGARFDNIQIFNKALT